MSIFEPDPNRRPDQRTDERAGQSGAERETGPGQPGNAVAPYRPAPVPDTAERTRLRYPRSEDHQPPDGQQWTGEFPRENYPPTRDLSTTALSPGGGYPPPAAPPPGQGRQSDRLPEPWTGRPDEADPGERYPAQTQPPSRYVQPRFPVRQLFEPPSRRAIPDAVRMSAGREDRSDAQLPERAETRPTRESTTRIALIYPELLGTYGDGGNAIVLAQRLRWRGMAAEVVSVPAGEPVPEGCDLYLLGGGEDEPQTLAAEGLRHNNAIARAVAGGAAVLAVCAGYQVIGQSFPAGGKIYDGLGLIDVETRRSFDPPDAPLPPRVVGDIVLDPDPSLRLPTVLGYENHGGRTRPLPGARGVPFGRVRVGLGNGIPDGTDGLVHGKVLGTYLHGPVLAQNPEVADLLLSWVHGELPPLPGPPEVDALRAARLRVLEVG